MTLTVRPVNTGYVIGFHKPTLTYRRGWRASMDVPLIMFVVEGGGAQIIVDTGRRGHGSTTGSGWNRSPSHDVRVLRRRIFAEERPQYSD